MKGWIVFFVFLIGFVPGGWANLVINEFLASNSEEDEFGRSLDWIELWNAGRETISLKGYNLTDDPLAPQKWQLPSIELSGGDYLLIWATGFDLLDPGYYHTNFRLDRDGEYLALTNSSGEEVDALLFPKQRRDVSYGRAYGKLSEWRYFPEPTPGETNRKGVLGFAASPRFSHEGGIHEESFELTLTTDEPDSEIRYTIDSSTPDDNSLVYRAPIPVDHTTMIRARVFREGYHPSATITHSYLFREDNPLPILSIVTDHKHLFDPSKGIYVNPSKHGSTWERPCSIEWFTRDGARALQANCGIRIHGGASRKRSPKKSFRLYFRSEYGPTRLKYPLIPDNPVKQFNQLVLRAGFNDSWGYDRDMQRETAIYVSDQVCRDLHLDMGQLASDGIFAELYLNGEPWGLYNVCERLEDDFYHQHEGGFDYDVIGEYEVRDGNQEAWDEFARFVHSKRNFSNSNDYATLQEWLDIENFTSYIILNVWMQNYDWPHHNWYAARERYPGAKWRFQLWDVEYSFGSGIQGYKFNQNTYQNATDINHLIGEIFHKLTHNTEYKNYYWRYLLEVLNDGALDEAHVHTRLNQRLEEIRPLIPKEAELWGRGMKIDDWERAIQLARNFIDQRTPIILDHTERLLGPKPASVSEWTLY